MGMDLPYQFPKAWHVETQEYDAAQAFQYGIITMSGNGYLGHRGAFPSWRAERYSGATIADTYDNADGVWKELCNAPNGLYLDLSFNGHPVACQDAARYVHGLDYRSGTTYGELGFEPEASSGIGSLRYRWERFASYRNLHVVLQRVIVTAGAAGTAALRWGIDGEVWSLNGEHFQSADVRWVDSRAVSRLRTTENGMELAVVSQLFSPGAGISSGNRDIQDRCAWSDHELEIEPNSPVELWMVEAIYHENDGPNPADSANQAIDEVEAEGFERHKELHDKHWANLWRSYDVRIGGNEEDQELLRYNTYHNVIATPAHTDHLPIGARGLSCQAYQGAAFWDQEIFNLPMYMYTRPEVARNILRYRHKTIPGAREKSERLGYRGAFYAWISGDTGRELCPDFFFRDVLSGRKIRNHFNDWQIHVSPDIAYAIRHYYRVTGDWSVMVEGGAEILFEIARFLYSHAYFKKDKDRYEIIRVLGPDEYHENADNSVFTNVQSKFALETALEVYDQMKEGSDSDSLRTITERLGLRTEEIRDWRDMAEKLYIPAPDPGTGLIEQFDGYFDLEDITPDALAERLIDPNEYWGWPNGIAYHTQVIKQADVVQMFALHQYPRDIVRKNYEYYEPRTQHRSSLSPGVHAMVAARLGNVEEAERYLEHSLTIDLGNTNPPESGGTFIGGIHTAACGIAWQIVVLGFLGLSVSEDQVRVEPRLPRDWSSVETSLVVRDHAFLLTADREAVRISSKSDNASQLRFYRADGAPIGTLEAGSQLSVPISR